MALHANIVAVLASQHDCVLSRHLPLVCDWCESMCDTQIMVLQTKMLPVVASETTWQPDKCVLLT